MEIAARFFLLGLFALSGAIDNEPNVGLIIWSDGATDAAADQAIASWKSLGIVSSQPPVKLLSGGVSGLRPGFHVVVLGVCPVADGENLVRKIHSVSKAAKGAYIRLVPLSAAIGHLTCPTITLPKQSWSLDCDDTTHVLTREVSIKDHAYTVRVRATVTGSCNGESASSAWKATATLERGGRVIDKSSDGAPDWAKITALGSVGKSIVLESEDNSSSCATGTMFDSSSVRRIWSTKHGKLVLKSVVTDEQRGLCEPSHEGQSECQFASVYARFDAVKGSCTKSAEACQKALDEYDDAHKNDPTESCEDANEEQP